MGNELVVFQEAFADKALPSRFNGNRFDKEMRWAAEKTYAQQVFLKNEVLQRCTPESIRSSMLEVAWSGLTLAPSLAHGYLIPYGDTERHVTECTFSPGYRGLAYLAQKGGAIKGLTVNHVYQHDKFRVYMDNNRRIVQHEEAWHLVNRGSLLACYCIAHLASGEDRVEVTPATIIKAAEQQASKRNAKGGMVWRGPFRDQMELKVSIRRCLKLVPADGSGWIQHAHAVSDKFDGIDFGPPPKEAGGGAEVVVNQEQVLQLHAALTDRGLPAADATDWLKHLAGAYGLRQIDDLPAKEFEAAKARLVDRYQRWAKKHGDAQ